MTHVRQMLTALSAVGLLVLAGCSSSGVSGGSDPGSSSGNSSGSSPASSNSVASDAAAKAKAAVAPYMEPVTAIGITGKLSSKPPTGKKVYWIQGNITNVTALTPGFKAAATALGWQLTTIAFDTSDPQGASSAMQQAVQAGADYIAVSGTATDQMGTALDDAKAKKIPVFGVFDSDTPGDAENGIYGTAVSTQWNALAAQIEVNAIIADSNGTADALFAFSGDFGIGKFVDDAVRGQFASGCPTTCSLKVLTVSQADVGAGKAAADIVSALQANPKIKYVLCPYGAMCGGLDAALDSAGMDAKVYGWTPSLEQINSMTSDGHSVAWAALGIGEVGWSVLDGMARLSVGETVDAKSHDAISIQVLTKDNAPKPAANWDGPPDYQSQFKALWGV